MIAKLWGITLFVFSSRDWLIDKYPFYQRLISLFAIFIYSPLLVYLVLAPAFKMLEVLGVYPRTK